MSHGGATARLFVAIDPPAMVRQELLAWARSAGASLTGRRTEGPVAPPMRVLDPDGLHLTLCFLGGRPVEEIHTISSLLAACAQQVGELSVGAPLWLPPRSPRALAVEVKDCGGELARLHAAVRHALSDATGLEEEKRRFRAHITVARMRGRQPPHRSRAPAQVALPATPPLSFTPAFLILYRSWLSPHGASYEPLASCDLQAVGG